MATAVIEFRNHWTATTKNPRKLDWDKTFANRLIELTDRLAFRRRSPSAAVREGPNHSPAFVRQMERIRQLELEEAEKAKEAS
jgi:hypothetical protein